MFPNPEYNQYAAGSKVYNGGSNAPTIGRVGNRLGTAQNTRELATRRNALLRRLQAGQKGNHMSSNWLGGNPHA